MTGADDAPARLVREFIDRINAGTDAAALLSDGVTVTVNGTTPLSGRYPGRALVEGILLDTARVVIASLHVEILDLIGKGPRLAALLALSGRDRTGREFNGEGRPCGCVFGVSDDHIGEILLFPDTSLIEMALYGRRFVPDV